MEHQTGPGWPGAGREDVVAESPGAGREDVMAESPGAGREDAAAAAMPAAAGQTPAPATGEPPAPATGEPRVDAALKLLDRLPGLPVSEHSELFEQVHAQLSEVLGELDPGPASSGPAGR
jgi:hypothetical protein